jgi:hypothetical protein
MSYIRRRRGTPGKLPAGTQRSFRISNDGRKRRVQRGRLLPEELNKGGSHMRKSSYSMTVRDTMKRPSLWARRPGAGAVPGR